MPPKKIVLNKEYNTIYQIKKKLFTNLTKLLKK